MSIANKLKRTWQIYSVTSDIVILIIVWFIFIFSYNHAHLSVVTNVIFILAALNAISDLIEAARGKNSLSSVVMRLAYCFLYLIGLFSFLYFSYGTSSNFSTPLSHFDAFYFALGTLTTGTGNINATSEVARYIQGTQMALDLLLIGFAVSLALARFAATRS